MGNIYTTGPNQAIVVSGMLEIIYAFSKCIKNNWLGMYQVES